MAVSPASIPFTVLLALAIGQLAWGPVSDRYGRKPVLSEKSFMDDAHG